MTVYRTQCTHCQHEFNISDAQLALEDGYARCGQCLQIFLALNNLSPISLATQSKATVTIIDKRDEPQIIPIRPGVLASVTTPAIDEAKLLFDDHKGLDDLSDDLPHKAAAVSEFNFDILDNFEKLSVPKTPSMHFDQPTLAVQSSADIPQKNTSHSNDEAWLEDLLNQEKQKELNTSYFDQQKNPAVPTQASDITSLLDDFEVEVAPEKQLSEADYQKRVHQRLTHQPATQEIANSSDHSGILSGIWLMGSLVLLLGLAVQYIAYHTDTIAKDPDQATRLRVVCESLHLPCYIPHADAMAINIQIISIDAKADKSDIMIMLTNQSNLTQLYPTLKLTLQANHSPVAQMIATPTQYLDDHTKILNPQQNKPIKLRLDLPRSQFDKIVIETFY